MADTAIAGRTTRRASTIFTVLVALGAVVLALVAPAPSARAETLFTDTFDDGDLNGWSTSGGTWSVVTDGTPAASQGGGGPTDPPAGPIGYATLDALGQNGTTVAPAARRSP